MRNKIRKLLPLICAISLVLTCLSLHTMANGNVATPTDLQPVQADTAETDTEPAETRADREISIPQDSRSREWTASGKIAETRKDYVIRLTSEKAVKLFFALQANDEADVTIRPENGGTEKAFTARERNGQEDGEPENLKEYILEDYDIQEGSCLIRITAKSGTEFKFSPFV